MPKLSDNQIGDLLHEARQALGEDEGATVRGHTAITAARQALSMLQVGLLYASERASDEVPGVITLSESSPPE